MDVAVREVMLLLPRLSWRLSAVLVRTREAQEVGLEQGERKMRAAADSSLSPCATRAPVVAAVLWLDWVVSTVGVHMAAVDSRG